MKINGEKNCKAELDDSLQNWSKYAKVYNPIKCASIDGTDIEPHDRAVIRALNSTYKPNRFVKGRPECTIFVSRLNHDTSKDTIKEIFSKYGKLKRFRMVKDIVTGMPKGYAFVEFEEEQAAEEAYRLANKTLVDGNIIFVDFECERLLKGWKPRRLGGGFAGKKESGQLRFGGRDRPFKKPIALELKEKEENRQREKKRRREEPKNLRDKSRERHKRRSPISDSGRNSQSKDKARHGSPLRDKAKQPLAAKEKERNNSPPRKVARLSSPLKETGKHQSPSRENPKTHSPEREIKPYSPQRNHVKRSSPRSHIRPHSPTRENTKHHSTSRKYSTHHSATQVNLKRQTSPTVKPRYGSPFQKTVEHYSPVSENADHHSRMNIKHSPPKENITSDSGRQDDRYSISRGENVKQKYSPIRNQNIEDHSSSHKHFRPNVRENDRRRSPLHRNDLSHLSTRDIDHFFPREDLRYQSPLQEETQYTSPRRNDRHFSPVRENDRQYFPPRENIRYRSPIRENFFRRSISPPMGKDRRNSPVRDFIKHYSPPRDYQQFFPSRESRHYSPPTQNIRNFPIQHNNTNYPPPYYSESQIAKKNSPVRENTRHFSPPRNVRQAPPLYDVHVPPPRENTRYFPPPRENERQYFDAKENASHSHAQDPENYNNFFHEQNNTTLTSPREATQFSQLRNNINWRSNPQNHRRRFPTRGRYRGGFRR